MSHFNTAALTDPVDRAAIRAAISDVPRADRAQLARETVGAIGSTVGSVLLTLLVVVVPGSFAPVLALVAPRVTPGMIAVALAGTAISILLMFTFGRWRLRSIRNVWKRRGGWEHRSRLIRFAGENGILYNPRPDNFPTLGSVLHHIKARYYDAFVLELDGKVTLFGNAVARNNTTHFGSWAPDGWFFLSTKLGAAVPRMMLIPRSRASQATTPMFNIQGSQRLRLEGDFDRHFALYAPASYERDALYVITPDLMALLIDHLPGAVVETIDDTLTITVPRPADFLDLATWPRITDVLGLVVPKAHRQTRRYRDERATVTGTVAQHGRILRPGIPIASAISTVLLVVTVVALLMR